MLRRCYYVSSIEKHPSYANCDVVKEWFIFSEFKSWMEKQDWKGNQLDKDILIQGNKTYGPLTCLFVSREVNMVIAETANKKGKFMQGVELRSSGKYRATISVDGKAVRLGEHDTEIEANALYVKAKYNNIRRVAAKQAEPLRSALLNYTIA